MTIINHGTFSRYTPALPEDHPLVKIKAMFAKREDGTDWYDIAHKKEKTGRTYVMVKDGRVCGYSKDISALWPEGCTVIETDQVVDHGYEFDGTTFKRPGVKPEEVKAEARRRILAKYPVHDQIKALRKNRGEVWAWIDAVETIADGMVAMNPIPADYRDDKHWPK